MTTQIKKWQLQLPIVATTANCGQHRQRRLIKFTGSYFPSLRGVGVYEIYTIYTAQQHSDGDWEA